MCPLLDRLKIAQLCHTVMCCLDFLDELKRSDNDHSGTGGKANGSPAPTAAARALLYKEGLKPSIIMKSAPLTE